MEKFSVGIIGVTEPAGAELVRLLAGHPLTELAAVSAGQEYEGRRLSELYPSLFGIYDAPAVSQEEVINASDIVFCALDSSDNQELAAQCIKQKCVFIDLGPAFRLRTEDEYSQWYGGTFAYKGLHEAAVYGLPELVRGALPGKVLIGCPGAVAAAGALALAPALSAGLLTMSGIIVDAKLPSGVFGANNGSSMSLGAGNFRETAELEQVLSEAAGNSIRLTVVPNLVSSARGVLVTCYAKGALAANNRTLRTAYEKFYAEYPFIRLLPAGSGVSTGAVCGSNFCDISLFFDERTATVAISAALDYYMKGSAGMAVQCMNLLLSIPEGMGIDSIPAVQ